MNVGGVQIGGGAPVVVQTMTKTETANLSATMDQIRKVAEAGADWWIEWIPPADRATMVGSVERGPLRAG